MTWVEDIFGADQATTGGVVRRNRADVDRYGSLQEIIDYADERGWHVIETGNQVVVLCHPGVLRIHS